MNLDIAVLSPEKTVITYRLATVGNRLLAGLVDVVVLIIVFGLLATGVGFLALVTPYLVGILSGFLIFIFSSGIFLYYILLEAFWGGQTLGKKICAIRVCLADGTPINFQAALTRNLLRPADMLPPPCFSGLVTMFLNPNLQRIGDLVAHTIVINDRAQPVAARSAPHGVGTHPLESDIGELKGMTDKHYMALRQFCDRFYDIPETQRAKLIDELWMPLKNRLRIQQRADIETIYYIEAVVMKFGRMRGLL